MPRQPRFVIPDQPQHFIILGNNREAIFYADGNTIFSGKIKQACVKHQCDIHDYVLMTNNIHLLQEILSIILVISSRLVSCGYGQH